jgi:hypothetical protein
LPTVGVAASVNAAAPAAPVVHSTSSSSAPAADAEPAPWD